jgi:hypothetical protein
MREQWWARGNLPNCCDRSERRYLVGASWPPLGDVFAFSALSRRFEHLSLGCAPFLDHQTAEVVGEGGERQFRLPKGNTDGADGGIRPVKAAACSRPERRRGLFGDRCGVRSRVKRQELVALLGRWHQRRIGDLTDDRQISWECRSRPTICDNG